MELYRGSKRLKYAIPYSPDSHFGGGFPSLGVQDFPPTSVLISVCLISTLSSSSIFIHPSLSFADSQSNSRRTRHGILFANRIDRLISHLI